MNHTKPDGSYSFTRIPLMSGQQLDPETENEIWDTLAKHEDFWLDSIKTDPSSETRTAFVSSILLNVKPVAVLLTIITPRRDLKIANSTPILIDDIGQLSQLAGNLQTHVQHIQTLPPWKKEDWKKNEWLKPGTGHWSHYQQHQ